MTTRLGLALPNALGASLWKTWGTSHGIVSTKELVRVVASQRETSAVLNSNFKAYLTSNAVKQHGIKLNVEIKPVSAEKGLQVVDCVSWSIFRQYEYGDPTYATLVDGRIVEESGIND